MKSLLLQEGQVKFNIFVPFQKSFQITDDQPEMPEEFTSLNLEQGYYVWGYASVQGVDLQGDMFPLETLKQMAPGLTRAPYNKIFLFHDYQDIASGTIVATATDDKGLLILAKLNEEHSRAQEVWGSVMNGTLDGFSMGGSFLRVDTIEDEESGMVFNVVREAISTEVSLTSAPINGGSLIMGAFKKSREIFNKAEDKQFNKSLKIEMKGDDKKFFINQEFMKAFAGYKNFDDCVNKNKDKGNPEAYCGEIKRKVEKSDNPDKPEKYIKKQNLNTDMVTKEKLNKKQKELFDKAISEGKNEDEALKIASAMLDEEAVKGAESKSDDLAKNPMKTGAENEKTKKKELKKSLDESESNESEESNSEEETETSETNDEEGDKAESSEEATQNESEEGESEEANEEESAEEKTKESESEDSEEESEEEIDYKQEYEKSLKTIAQLESELNTFKKSLPGNESDEPEKKPMRKSVKTKQSVELNVNNSKSPKSKTPMLDWIGAV